MMNLTKQEAIAWHRKMWIWIAREIARNKQVIDISYLKGIFCAMYNVEPVFSCFCCEYCEYANLYCGDCPLVWGNDTYARCFDAEYSNINDLYNECFLYDLCEYEKAWKKQAKLAYKIAMLPERKDV